MPNFFVFIHDFVAIQKQKRSSCLLSELQTRTNIKTRQFCISYLVFSQRQMQRNKHKNEKNEDMSMFFLISLNSTPHVPSCQQVLTSSRIQVYTTRFYAASHTTQNSIYKWTKLLTLEMTICGLKNDGEKWCRFFYFEIERAPSELLLQKKSAQKG